MTFKELYQKLTSRVIWGNLMAMAVVSVVMIVGLFVFLDFYTHHGDTVAVPNVVGQRFDVAQRKLEAAGLRVEVSDTGHITSIAPDVILEQHIAAGTEVKLNRLVRLTINSATAKALPLPAVVDGSLREAQMRLKSMGFSLGAVKRIVGDLDLVYRLEVHGREVYAGQRISVESPITIVVGDGKVEDYYNGDDSAAWVSDLQYQTEQEIRHLLEGGIYE